jgi:hypothetical protein
MTMYATVAPYVIPYLISVGGGKEQPDSIISDTEGIVVVVP